MNIATTRVMHCHPFAFSALLIAAVGAVDVLLKTLVYYPAYIFDVAAVRSLSHLASVASLINVAWSVATGGL